MNDSNFISADTLTIDQVKSMAQAGVTNKEIIPLEYVPVIIGALALGVYLVMKKKPKRKNPRRNEYDEDEEFTPDDEDCYLSDSGPLGSRTSVSCGGKFIGEYKTESAAAKAVKAWMKKEKYYPSIWKVSDHGNISPYSL